VLTSLGTTNTANAEANLNFLNNVLQVTGSIVTNGSITAQTLNVQQITSSVSFITGSTKFGTLTSNTHQFTGSVSILGGPLDLGIAEFNPTSSTTTAGSLVVSSINTSSFNSAFYNYSISSGSNARAGQIMSIWNGTTIRFTEVTTTDIGNTNSALFAVGISGANVQLQFTSSGAWIVKSIANLL
jgi:hypothetical protein